MVCVICGKDINTKLDNYYTSLDNNDKEYYCKECGECISDNLEFTDNLDHLDNGTCEYSEISIEKENDYFPDEPENYEEYYDKYASNIFDEDEEVYLD